MYQLHYFCTAKEIGSAGHVVWLGIFLIHIVPPTADTAANQLLMHNLKIIWNLQPQLHFKI